MFRTLDEIKADGTVNIGVFSDKNPFGYVDENGEYQGYDVYFARRLAEESFFHKDYEETLVDTYGLDYEDELVVEGGEANA